MLLSRPHLYVFPLSQDEKTGLKLADFTEILLSAAQIASLGVALVAEVDKENGYWLR